MTKDSGCDVFVAESTRSGLRSPTPDLESVAELALRGRREPVRLAGIRTGHGRIGGHELV
jgi:class 3 adenylate cyclase